MCAALYIFNSELFSKVSVLSHLKASYLPTMDRPLQEPLVEELQHSQDHPRTLPSFKDFENTTKSDPADTIIATLVSERKLRRNITSGILRPPDTVTKYQESLCVSGGFLQRWFYDGCHSRTYRSPVDILSKINRLIVDNTPGNR